MERRWGTEGVGRNVEMTDEELRFLIQAAQMAQIQGRHAHLVAGVIDKLNEQLSEQEVEHGNDD